MKQITINEALQIAIDAEIKAYNLYLDTSEKVANAGTKAMLIDLANMELGHRKLLEGVVNKGEYAQLGENEIQESPGIADFLVTSELQKNATPQDVMIFAIKEEEKAYHFYKDMENNFSGTDLQNMFNKLALEELGHKRKLEEEYDTHFMREN